MLVVLGGEPNGEVVIVVEAIEELWSRSSGP